MGQDAFNATIRFQPAQHNQFPYTLLKNKDPDIVFPQVEPQRRNAIQNPFVPNDKLCAWKYDVFPHSL